MLRLYFVLIFVIYSAVICPSWGAPVDTHDAQILSYENENVGADGYKFFFETSDGISRKEIGTLKNVGTVDEAISVQGTVSWEGPDGVAYTLNYLANENGFQPEGKHLPVPAA